MQDEQLLGLRPPSAGRSPSAASSAPFLHAQVAQAGSSCKMFAHGAVSLSWPNCMDTADGLMHAAWYRQKPQGGQARPSETAILACRLAQARPTPWMAGMGTLSAALSPKPLPTYLMQFRSAWYMPAVCQAGSRVRHMACTVPHGLHLASAPLIRFARPA